MHCFKKENATYHIRSGSLFNGFNQSVAGQAGSVQGVPGEGLIAWWNPAVGVTTMVRTAYDGSVAVADWADMSGNYHLQATATSQGNILSPPRYITSANSTYNNIPYMFFDGGAGQSRNLSMAGRTDENWLTRTISGHSTVYAVNFLTTLGQSTSWVNSFAGAFYYDNSVFFRANAPGVGYPYKSETQPVLNSVHVIGHHYDATTGRWWWSLNGNYKVGFYTDASIYRNGAAPYSIYNNLTWSFLSVGAGNGQLHLFDMMVYSRVLDESDYKKIYEHIKNKYRV